MAASPFDDFISYLAEKLGEENWVTAYESHNDSDHDGGMYCALVEPKNSASAMSQVTWDLMIGSGGPGFYISSEKGERVVTYYTNAHERFIRLVINREFHGRKKDYVEILEEFRLFHNLYYDERKSIYIAFDDAGDEVEVVRVLPREVKIRRGYLRGFMAAKQIDLLLYFELTRHFKQPESFRTEVIGDSLSYTIYSGESYREGYASFSRILGKKLIRHEPIENSGIWPFERPKNYQEFIIGGDPDAPKTFICDPDRLANYFGANPGAPNYLTPVFFRKEVMQKYYGSSDYEIGDGQLYRHGAWSLRFDNNAPGHVSVYLGDLGRGLPEKEQIYWKSFNIVPDGRRISKTNFQRSIMGNFFDPENPEHQFKHEFRNLQRHWEANHGWMLFLPLSTKDRHYFESLRSMLTNEQSEFDEQILALAKITIDSVNVTELRTFVGIEDSEVKSIDLMEGLFRKRRSPNADELTALLRGIQSVRSSGVAHRKGTEFEKVMARLKINEADYQAEFDEILKRMVQMFRQLATDES